jgi:tRNA threonylcarbamoyladenosine biosynthesis protein TsaE
MPVVEMQIASEAEMLAFGRSFSEKLNAGDIVAIEGTLGAGKTVFCRAVLAGLGFEGDVTSPTYTIVHHYDHPDVRLAVDHIDLYRIENSEEVVELGLFEDGRISLVEWAGQYPPLNTIADYRISIVPDTNGVRLITVEERN